MTRAMRSGCRRLCARRWRSPTRRRRRRRPRRHDAVGLPAEPVGARRVSRRSSCCSPLSMFGFYELQLPAALQTPAVDGRPRHPRRPRRRRLPDGRAVGGHRRPVRRRAAGRRAAVYRPDRATSCSAARRCSRWRSAWACRCWSSAPPPARCCRRPGRGWNRSSGVFGVAMLAVAIYMVSPVMPLVVQQLLWAALLIVPAIFLHALDPLPPTRRATGGCSRASA